MSIDINDNAAEIARGANKRKAANASGQTSLEIKQHSRKPEDYSEVLRTVKSDNSAMTAFMVQPKGVHFDSQDSEEKILLLLRKHFITNVGWILSMVFGLILPIIASYVPAFYLIPVNYQVVSACVWYLAVFGFGFEKFLSWYFHVYIITDERIIDYDFYSLLYKRVSKAKIDNIEDVTYEMGGIWSSFFHYGNVFIQTAGEKLELDFEDVPNPELISKLLNELMIEEEQEKLDGRVR